MFTADDYFNITNARILNENVNHLDERKVEPDEKLPSGKTPNEKMERAQGKHGANYMLTPGRGRNNPARDSHFSRGSKVKKIADIIKSGEDPRNSPQAGVGWGNDARKTGRPGVSTADRTSRTQRNDDTDAKSTYTQGGLRAHKTRAGGYRTLTRKEEYEYNELLKFLYFEGYADSYAEAEELLESMSNDEFEDLCEKKLAHSFPLKPSQRRSVENIGRMNRGDFSVPPGGSARKKSASMQEPKLEPQEQPKPRKRTTDLTKVRMREEFEDLTERMRDEPSEAEQFRQSDMIARNPRVRAEREAAAKARLKSQGLKRKDGTSVFEEVVEYLFVEGFAETIESAEVMAENISGDWVNEILDEKYVKSMDTTGRGADHRTRFPQFKGKDGEFDPKFTQQRVKSNTKKIDPYFSGRKERKDEKRQGTGGFGA